MDALRLARDPNRNQSHLEALKALMLSQAGAGYGVHPQQLPRFFIQRRDECQTIAIFNGALAMDHRVRELYGTDLFERIEKIRAKARALGRDRDLDLNTVNRIVGESYPIQTVVIGNRKPLEFIAYLFGRNRFAVYSGPGHAYTILPVANPTRNCFVIQVDSLNGKTEPLSLDQFFNLYFDPGRSGFFNIFEWRGNR